MGTRTWRLYARMGNRPLDNDLLRTIRICAYPQSALFIYHWSIGEELPTPFFAHLRDNDIVVHTRPANVLHLFTFLSTHEQLIEQLLAICEYQDIDQTDKFKFSLAHEDLVRVREFVELGVTKDAYLTC